MGYPPSDRWPWCGCKVVGIVLYDLPAIRSVWLLGLQGCGMVLYDLPAIRSVALVWLQGCGDSALWATRHQVGVALWPARL